MLPALYIENEGSTPKYLKVLDGILKAIKKGYLKKGQKIPSINEFSHEYGISRVTVERAYKKLMSEGIIQSTKGKGYYVKAVEIDAKYRVLLIFNKISHYKKEIYNSFIKTLGNTAKVDLKIHHFNAGIFKELIETHLNEYDYFVVMPHFYEDADSAIKILQTIPTDQLIILDKKLSGLSLKCGAVYQDFENDILGALYEVFDSLKKYRKLVMIDSVTIPSPPEKVIGFKKFCMQNSIKNEVIKEITIDTKIERGELYIVTEDSDLANLVKICLKNKFKVGKEIGILSYNETPLKEILLDGISVITTDHSAMGSYAANLILTNSKENIKNKFSVIKRMSL